MKDNGFTLIELLAVIVILIVILAIAVPSISNVIDSAKVQAYKDNEKALIKATKNYLSINDISLPTNIGESIEVKLTDLQTNNYIGIINSPEDKTIDCNGYVLITKIDDKQYDYIPHLNCVNNIGSSLEDKLLAHYKFDNFQEPTENLVANGDFSNGMSSWSCTTAEVDMNNYCQIKYENGEPYLHIHWERVSGSGNHWTTLKSSSTYNIVGVPYALSCKIRINGESGDVTRVRHSAIDNDFWTSGITTWSLSGRTLGVWYDVNLLRTFEASYTYTPTGVVYPLSGRFEIYSGNFDNIGEYVDFDIKLVQVEQKAYSTPFANGSREGIVRDLSGQGNNATLQLSGTPKWISDNTTGDGSYQFDGVNDRINLGPIDEKILRQGMESESWTLSLWAENIPLQDNNSRILLARPGYHAGLQMDMNMRVRFAIFNENDISPEVTSQSLEENTSHHIVGVYSDKTMYLYIDGELVGKNTYYKDNPTVRFKLNTQPFMIGSYTDGSCHQYRGGVDDVRIYGRALSPNEIKNIYNMEKIK